MSRTSFDRFDGDVCPACLLQAAQQARMSLFNAGQGRFQLSWGFGRGCELQRQGGWFTATDLRPAARDGAHLTAHADWSGPARYEQNGAVVARLTLPLGEADAVLFAESDRLHEANRSAEYLSALLGRIPDWLRGEVAAGWEPPTVDQLADWLAETGCPAVADDIGGLRLALARKSCDGPVKVERSRDRLRMTLRLGEWTELSSTAQRAMRQLLQSANHRCRMVRHVWIEADERTQCTAMIDLTGLPVPAEGDAIGTAVWRATVQAAVDGLQLALDRLGLELDALADPAHSDLVEAFHALATSE